MRVQCVVVQRANHTPNLKLVIRLQTHDVFGRGAPPIDLFTPVSAHAGYAVSPDIGRVRRAQESPSEGWGGGRKAARED